MQTIRRPRALLLTGALAGLDVLVWRATAGDRAAALGPAPTLVELLTALAGLAVLLTLAWLTLLGALLAVETRGSGDLTSRAGCPPALRRALLVVCGVAVAGAVAVPAQAAPADDPSPSHAAAARGDDGPTSLLDGLPLPDRPTGSAPQESPAPGRSDAPATRPDLRPDAGPGTRAGAEDAPTWDAPAADRTARSASAPPASGRAARAATGHVPGRHAAGRAPATPAAPAAPRSTPDSSAAAASDSPTSERAGEPGTRPGGPASRVVRPGDTLWALARAELPPDAPASRVTQTWMAIYSANRDVLGPDPDLIHPGTTVHLPPTHQEDQP